MKFPNAASAIISREKLADYLLDPSHPDGGSKADLLISFGYVRSAWQILEDDIRRMHLEEEVVATKQTSWGTRYEIVAPLVGPNGDGVLFRSVWQIDLGTDRPRLITMYPE
jgi:hypothetical protein